MPSSSVSQVIYLAKNKFFFFESELYTQSWNIKAKNEE